MHGICMSRTQFAHSLVQVEVVRLLKQDPYTALITLNILMHRAAEPDVAVLGDARQGNLFKLTTIAGMMPWGWASMAMMWVWKQDMASDASEHENAEVTSAN
jgi:hypothetical protein